MSNTHIPEPDLGTLASGVRLVQVANLQNDLYALAEGCWVECVLLIPLLRALSLFSLKRSCQPACSTGKIWQHVLFERCKEYIVHALEEVCSQPEEPFAGVLEQCSLGKAGLKVGHVSEFCAFDTDELG
jgi:hypothetical protein